MTAVAGQTTCNVLLVEDNPGDARLIVEMLSDLSSTEFSLERVGSLAPALERLTRAGVDVVLLDLGLPDSEGLETFLRARRGAPTEPIVVISGLDDERLALEAVRAGAQDYLVKGRIEGNLLARVIRYAVERKHAEEALRISEERFRLLAETSFDGMDVIQDGIVQEANQGFAEMFGYAIREVIGRPITDFVAEESRELTLGRVAARTEGRYDVIGKRKDGKRLFIEVAARGLSYGGKPARIAALRDVTERRALEDQLRQAQKMEAVGQLAGGVAHDFNNLLTAIFGYLDFMAADLAPGSRALEDLGEVRKAAQRAADLTRQLLAFSRKQMLQPKVLQLNEVVAETEKLLRRVIGEDVELHSALAPDLGNALADPGQIEQVLMNLAVNARDAMPKGGKLSIETANAELGELHREGTQSVVPGPYVLLAVSDSGTGMDAATQARIFEPFFTTKDKTRGTGLGLSTVYGIVKQSSGYIWVYSEAGIGTTFKIYLPRVDAPVALANAPSAVQVPITGTETILVTEDDDQLRPLIGAILRRFGYQVLTASGAEMAVRMAAEHQGVIHLLVTDVVMPGANGREVARLISGSRPGIRVLYVSGYADDAIVRHGILDPGIDYLAKPFSLDQLGRKIRDVLDAG